MNIKQVKLQWGFTLVELLVVVSIIGIIAAVGVVSYSNISKYNRDQKRVRDLNAMKQALELFRTDQGYYPSSWTLSPGSPLIYTDPSSSNTKTYMQDIPLDPLSGSSGGLDYKYSCAADSSGNCPTYCIYAEMEGSGYSLPGLCPPVSYYNYAVTPD